MYKYFTDFDERPFITVGLSDDCPSVAHDGWYCTLSKGHGGFHAAHSTSNTHPLAIWDDEGAANPSETD